MVQVKKKISQLFQREAATNCTKTAEGTFRNHGVTAGVDFTRGSASLGDDWGGGLILRAMEKSLENFLNLSLPFCFQHSGSVTSSSRTNCG